MENNWEDTFGHANQLESENKIWTNHPAWDSFRPGCLSIWFKFMAHVTCELTTSLVIDAAWETRLPGSC